MVYNNGCQAINYKKILYFLSEGLFLSKQTVLTLMECLMLRHFIWVFTVSKSTHLGVSRIYKGSIKR